jgi:hypothetical protein
MDMEQRQFRADPLKLKRLRIAAGMTVEDFCHFSQLDKTTARKVLSAAALMRGARAHLFRAGFR